MGSLPRLYVDSGAVGVSGDRDWTVQDDGRLVIELERRGVRRYVCSGCGRRHRARPRCEDPDVGRPAVGGASGHAALPAAAALVPALRHSHRARRLRRSARAR